MQTTTNSPRGHLIGFFAIAFILPLYLLLLSGFPTIAAVKVCAMILVQITAGGLIWLTVSKPSQICVTETVGIGLALGSIFGVVGHQFLLSTSISAFGWLLPVIVALVLNFVSPVKQDTLKNFEIGNSTGFFFVVISVVLILRQWWWLLPLALPTVLALYVFSTAGKAKLLSFVKPVWIVVIITYAAVTVLVVRLRQLNFNWWIRSWDLQFFESISYSIAKFGQNENISLVGYPIDYHWFGLAWLGSISIITELGPWFATTQVAPVYSVIAVGALIYSLAKRTSSSQVTKYVMLGIFAFVSGFFSPANPPNITSLIWMFGAIVVAQEFYTQSKSKVFFVLGLLTIATFSSKVSSGFSVLCAILFIDTWLQLKAKSFSLLTILRDGFLVASTLFAFYFIIGGQDRLGDSYVAFNWKNPAYFLGADIGRSDLIYLIATFGYFLGLIPICIGIFLPIKDDEPRQKIVLFCRFGFLALLIPSVLFEDNLGYFVVAAKILAVIGSAITLTSPTVIKKFILRTKFHKVSFFLIAILLGIAFESIYKINWREISRLRGGPTPILVFILLCYLTISLLISHLFARFSETQVTKGHKRARIIYFAIFLTIGAVASPFSTYLQGLPSNFVSQTMKPEMVGSIDLNGASNWLKIHSDETEIVATNKFCIEDSLQNCFFPKYFGVSSTTRLRILIEGPFYLFGRASQGTDPVLGDESLYPKWAKERLDLSRGFADRPTAEITARLREFGVDWFYLFKENTKNRNWEPYGTVEYENIEIAIIKLNDK